VRQVVPKILEKVRESSANPGGTTQPGCRVAPHRQKGRPNDVRGRTVPERRQAFGLFGETRHRVHTAFQQKALAPTCREESVLRRPSPFTGGPALGKWGACPCRTGRHQATALRTRFR